MYIPYNEMIFTWSFKRSWNLNPGILLHVLIPVVVVLLQVETWVRSDEVYKGNFELHLVTHVADPCRHKWQSKNHNHHRWPGDKRKIKFWSTPTRSGPTYIKHMNFFPGRFLWIWIQGSSAETEMHEKSAHTSLVSWSLSWKSTWAKYFFMKVKHDKKLTWSRSVHEYASWRNFLQELITKWKWFMNEVYNTQMTSFSWKIENHDNKLKWIMNYTSSMSVRAQHNQTQVQATSTYTDVPMQMHQIMKNHIHKIVLCGYLPMLAISSETAQPTWMINSSKFF